jgi:hypothetical protein
MDMRAPGCDPGAALTGILQLDASFLEKIYLEIVILIFAGTRRM